MDLEGMMKLGVLEQRTAERLRELCVQKEVKVELVHNPETCAVSPMITVELWVDVEDKDMLKEIISSQKQMLFKDIDYDFSLLDEVHDADQETATCPACSSVFDSKGTECPSCGLSFGELPGS